MKEIPQHLTREEILQQLTEKEKKEFHQVLQTN